MRRTASLVLIAAMAAPGLAQSLPGAWQLGTVNQRDNRQHLASLRSTSLLSGTDEEQPYAPIFTVSCLEGDPQHWQQQIMLEEPLTSRGFITMNLKLDDQPWIEEQWVVTGDRRTATKVGSREIARLSQGGRLKLQWNWGWSWLWLSDEAVFDLADMRTVLFTLATSCAVPVPR